MLPKNLRLPSKNIKNVAFKGLKEANDYLTLRFEKKDKGSFFAISISTKVNKSAVVRNLIKRKLREAIRVIVKKHEITLGNYLLIVKSDTIKDLNPFEIQEMLETLLIKLQTR